MKKPLYFLLYFDFLILFFHNNDALLKSLGDDDDGALSPFIFFSAYFWRSLFFPFFPHKAWPSETLTTFAYHHQTG